jgi:hypothetical protein
VSLSEQECGDALAKMGPEVVCDSTKEEAGELPVRGARCAARVAETRTDPNVAGSAGEWPGDEEER